MILFIHIPKTSGTSLRKYLHQIGNVERTPMIELKPGSKADIISGHIFYKYAEQFYPDADYITILRHPVDRAVSHFMHIKQDRHHYLHKRCTGTTLSEFIRDPSVNQTISNLQTKYLSAMPSVADVPTIEVSRIRASLDEARTILDKFFYVGFQEDHVGLVRGLFCKLGLSEPKVEQRKTNNYRTTLSHKDAKVLIELNKVDMQLYEYARREYG